MISWSSTLASSAPATSSNVTLGVSPVSSFAFDLPKLKAFAPPACIERNRKNQIPKIRRYGNRLMRIVVNDGRASSA